MNSPDLFRVGDKALLPINDREIIEVEVIRVFEEEPLYEVSWWDDSRLCLRRLEVFSDYLIPLEGDYSGRQVVEGF